MKVTLASRHVCKFCSKSFACGRSLGGHMRSHLTNNLAENYTDEKHCRTSLQFGGNYSGGSISNMEEEETDLEGGNNLSGFGYGLRRNPKKTQKLEFLSEESSFQDKFCRECGKVFQSWKALFGHMKCHSIFSSEEMEEQQDNSLIITDPKQKIVMDIQSDNETEPPNKRKRSTRRRTSAQIGTANSTSSTVCEIEQEQEVAISLMLLSMDVGNWVGFNSTAESSDNNSKFLESKTCVSNGCELVKSNKSLKGKKMECEVKQQQSDQKSFGIMNKMIKKSQPAAGSKSKSKPKSNSEMFLKPQKKTLAEFWDTKICKKPKKRSKFECDICNKIFDSYQALGGHRASHKKLKGFFVESAMEEEQEEEEEEEEMGSESSLEMGINSEGVNNGGSEIEKTMRKHKCPICEKVFASGQALGGHKRSHLIRETIEIHQKKVPEIRGFLDLNLPPQPLETETSFKNPWWVAPNHQHKHEPLLNVGLFHI